MKCNVTGIGNDRYAVEMAVIQYNIRETHNVYDKSHVNCNASTHDINT